MADQLDVAFGPDPVLASLEQQHRDGLITSSAYIAARDARTSKLMQEVGTAAISIGGQGFFTPSLNTYNANDELNAAFYEKQESLKSRLVGKSVLQPTGEGGVYSASTYDSAGNLIDASITKTNDPAAKGMPNYDPNATGSQRIFYDAQGRKISAADIAKTETGREFAAAGWDIGFGPGMIGPGIKADTSERDARIAAREESSRSTSQQQPRQVSSTPSTPSTVSSQPSNVSPVTQAPPPPPVKTAPIDTILFNEDAVPIQIMSDLLFENIGGQELINIARNDTVNGQKIIYQPIKNLTQIQREYNPNNIVSLNGTSDKYFQSFAIKLNNKVPTNGTGPNGSHVYIETTTGSLIVEAINLQDDEQIEVEITTGGTIYEAEL